MKKENAKQKVIIEAIDDVMMPLPFETDFDKAIKTEKSKAIKEFAGRLKESMRLEDDCEYDCGQCCYECREYVPIIDNLAKEMTGEEKMNKQYVEDDVA